MSFLFLNETLRQGKLGRKVDIASRFSLPAFATWSNVGNSSGGAKVYDHNFCLLADDFFSQQHSYPYKTFDSTNGSEGWNSVSSRSYTNSTVTTSSSYAANFTSAQGHMGHASVFVSPTGFAQGHNRYTRNYQSNMSVGTWLHNSTPMLSLHTSGNDAWFSPRSYLAARDTHGAIVDINTLFTLESVSKYGMISYNEKTKKLCIGDRNTNQLRVHVWSDIESPAKFVSNTEWFNHVQAQDGTRQTSSFFTVGSNNNSIAAQRYVLVMCDNGKVFVGQMYGPASATYFGEFSADLSTYTALESMSWTTVYSEEQGSQYGIRHMVTNDGKYVIIYSHGYYYGASVKMVAVRVSDGKYIQYSPNDTSNGYAFAPIRDSHFIMSRSSNSDSGSMVNHAILNCADFIEQATIGDTWSPSFETGALDTFYHSTNYPTIIPILDEYTLNIFAMAARGY